MPVVILFFNRPEFLRQLIGRLAEVKPKKLYLVCDGPRQNKIGEKEKVEECRCLFEHLDWNCEIQRNFSDVNLGCRDRIISGLDWVFEQEERAIILEDDCIPVVDFFAFAEAMLERYRDDIRILSVCGYNLRPQLSNPDYDVVFSKYAMVWGWATWRRAWKLLERDLTKIKEVKKFHLLQKWLGSWRAECYWCYVLNKVVSTWDYRWAYTGFLNKMVHVLPSKCLVNNIGLADVCATHTTSTTYDFPEIAQTYTNDYRIPEKVVVNFCLDQWIEDHLFSRSLVERIRWVLKKVKRCCYGKKKQSVLEIRTVT